MSAAPPHPARPPPGHAGHHPGSSGASHRAAGSSRVQVVVLAAARLRALHLDPLVTGSDAPIRRAATQETANSPLAPGPRLHRETAR